MPRARLIHLAAVIAALALALAALASSALAKRAATGAGKRGIEVAARAYLATCDKKQKSNPRFIGIYVSTADARYGEALVHDNATTCFAFAVYVKRASASATTWKTVGQFGDSLKSCSSFSYLPAAVRKDFKVGGLRANGTTGIC